MVVRTSRGLETGEILGPAEDAALRGASDGSILRGMTEADELLKTRLEKNRQQAIDACTARLAERNIQATLLDIEHLFDGRSLFFYFMGEVTPEIESITAELAEVYDAAAEFRKFSETLATGCGPGCGTDEAKGQGGCTTMRHRLRGFGIMRNQGCEPCQNLTIITLCAIIEWHDS